MEYSIGQVSKIMNMSIHTLRFYEKKGLIEPSRDNNNNRIFFDTDINRLKMIENFKMIGTSLSNIEKFFSFFGDKNEMENRKQFLLDERERISEIINDFQKGQSFLDKILDECYFSE